MPTMPNDIFSRWYWLDMERGEPVAFTSLGEYLNISSECQSTMHFHVGLTELNGWKLGPWVIARPVKVSTVFLGLDHGFWFQPVKPYRPVLFESMIFGGPFNDEQERYCTIEEAQDGHQRMVRLARLGRWFGRRLTEWWINK